MKAETPILLIDIGEKQAARQDAGNTVSEPERVAIWKNFADQQFLAISRAISLSQSAPPLLISDKKPTETCSLQFSDVPFERILRPSLLGSFHIWRWQKSQGDLAIIANGLASLPLAVKIASRRPANSTKVYGLFYLPGQPREKILSSLTACICFSPAAFETLPKEAPQKIFCLPGMELAYPLETANQREDFQPGKRNFVFGMTESLVKSSGALSVCRAMAAIWQIEDAPTWEVRMFGGGPRYEAILEEARKLGVLSRLSILADQPLETVAPLCDSWLAPGYSSLEAPPALWTGIGANLPIIASRTPLHEALLPDARNAALLVEPESPQELATAMLEILKNPDLRTSLVSAATHLKKQIGLNALTQRVLAFIGDN